jgi:glucose-1-phosphate thymidylyltransferase
MNAIILAAGFGTRLYPLTQNKPKAFLEIGGKTLLDHLMDKLEPVKAIREVTLVTNGLFYLDFYRWRKTARSSKMIHIEDNNVFVPEGRLGAVRDLYLALKRRQNQPEGSLILLSDNYFDFPLGHFLLCPMGHPMNAFIGLYDLKDVEKAKHYGVCGLDESHQIISFEEKPVQPKSTLVSAGVYYLPKEFILRVYEYLEIERLSPDRIGDFISWLSKRETLYGIEFDGHWFDIGTLEVYQELSKIGNCA